MECSYFCRLGVQSDASRPNRVGEGKSDRQHCNTCGDQAGINSNQAFDAATYGVFFSASAHQALSLSHAKEHKTEQLRQESAGLFSNSVTELNERCGRGCLTTCEPTVGPAHFRSRGLKSRCAWPRCDVLRGGRTPFLNEHWAPDASRYFGLLLFGPSPFCVWQKRVRRANFNPGLRRRAAAWRARFRPTMLSVLLPATSRRATTASAWICRSTTSLLAPSCRRLSSVRPHQTRLFQRALGGVSANGGLFGFFWTDHCSDGNDLGPLPDALLVRPTASPKCPETDERNRSGRSVVARSDDDGRTFRNVVQMPAGFVYVVAVHTRLQAVLPEDQHLGICFRIPRYRASAPYLAQVAVQPLTDLDSWSRRSSRAIL